LEVESMHRPTARILLVACAALAAGTAAGVGLAYSGIKISINGVDVTGLTNQKFEGCTVAFDSEGNIDIKAPGYEIKKIVPDSPAQPDKPAAKGPSNLDSHYYMFTESKNGSSVGDVYTLIVNDEVVKKFKSSDEMIVEDITEHLKDGNNLVLLTAVKSDSYGGGSSKSWFRIVIGEGHEEDNKAVIKKTLHKFTRLASDQEPGQSAYTLKAK
jgi:hypothetical protein